MAVPRPNYFGHSVGLTATEIINLSSVCRGGDIYDANSELINLIVKNNPGLF